MNRNNNTAFSHRPIAGVSVGAYSDGARLYVAASFTNDGFSRSGNYRPEHDDAFSRAMARKIIAGRIEFAKGRGSEIPGDAFVIAINTDINARQFMGGFRHLFKPDVFETDNTFSYSFVDQLEVEHRARMNVRDMWDTIIDLSKEVVNSVTVNQQ